MKPFRIANIVLRVEDFLEGHENVLYRATGETSYDQADGSLSFSGDIDFSTYFNAISVEKWRRYTGLDNLKLHLEAKGDGFRIETRGMKMQEDKAASCVGKVTMVEATDDYHAVEVDIPLKGREVAGFILHSNGTTRIRGACYLTEVEETRIRPIKLALCTTTFKKEEFVIPNIERVKREVLACDEPIADNFHMFVVDNGRTLDAGTLSDEGVTVCPNDNVGGSGGFARGMIEAMDAPDAYTHVILMDDDVRVSPESFKRVFALLSLANPEYVNAFINGAMLEMERPNIMFEDVSVVRSTGGYVKIKPDLYIDRLDGLVRNESLDVEIEGAYGAWWFSCIPMAAIREYGLPLPLFVRCDDVEYGMRCKPTYMTMNGICVWHSRFTGRFRASVDCYQYTRNMLITIAVDNCSSESIFMMRFWRVFRIYLRTLNYESAELWLDGLEDYLKGPDYLMKVDGSALMKANSAKNEKLEPLENLDSGIVDKLEIKDEWLEGEDTRNDFLKLMETVPHDRHFFPDWMLRNKPAMVAPDGSLAPWSKTAMRKHLVAVDVDRKNGHIRTVDRARYKELVDRYSDLHLRYVNNRLAVAEAYRDKFRYMTSVEFWKDYLKLDEDEAKADAHDES